MTDADFTGESTRPRTGSHPQLAVVDSDPLRRAELASALDELHTAVTFVSLEQFQERVSRGTPVVVVAGPTFGDGAGLAALEDVTRARPEIGVLLVVESLSTEVLQGALRAGVRDVVTFPLVAGQLEAAIDRVAASLPVINRPTSAPVADDVPLGRVVTVFSTKGGAGKSVLAANLAVSLARRSSRPVVLLDADLQFGDIAVMLKVTPQHTIVDAVNGIDKLDADVLQQLLVRHEPSGLYVLAAPLEPAFADQVRAPQMLKVIELLRTMAAFIVVDTPAYFNDVVLSLIEESDDVLLVAGMDIPNIKNVKIGLQTLRLLNIPVSKLKLILNRANSKVKLEVGEVERTLTLKADCLVPSDVVVPQSVNKGEPVVLGAPKSGVARAIETLADTWAPVEGRRRR